MKTRTIKQTVTFNTTPEKLYALLFDSKKLSVMHGGKTSMTKRANGKFTVFGGYCHGHNIELTEGKKIVQAWHFNEEGWPEDHFSTCTFLLEPSIKGTKLTFTQTDVPASTYESLSDGWKTYYWIPIEEYLIGK
jgi:activator of HSP90 ATPase